MVNGQALPVHHTEQVGSVFCLCVWPSFIGAVLSVIKRSIAHNTPVILYLYAWFPSSGMKRATSCPLPWFPAYLPSQETREKDES